MNRTKRLMIFAFFALQLAFSIAHAACVDVSGIVDRALVERTTRSVQEASGAWRSQVTVDGVQYCDGILEFTIRAAGDHFLVRITSDEWKELEVRRIES